MVGEGAQTVSHGGHSGVSEQQDIVDIYSAPSGRHSSTQPPSPVRVYRVTDSTTPVLLEATCCGLMGPAAVSSDRSQAIDCWAPPPPGASSGTSQFIR